MPDSYPVFESWFYIGTKGPLFEIRKYPPRHPHSYYNFYFLLGFINYGPRSGSRSKDIPPIAFSPMPFWRPRFSTFLRV